MSVGVGTQSLIKSNSTCDVFYDIITVMKTNKILWLIFAFIVILGLFYLSQKKLNTEVDVPVISENLGIDNDVIGDVPNEEDVVLEKEELAVVKKTFCDNNNGVWYEYNSSCEINSLSKDACVTKGGEFNECNSACRHDKKTDMCTMQCVITCTFK